MWFLRTHIIKRRLYATNRDKTDRQDKVPEAHTCCVPDEIRYLTKKINLASVTRKAQ